MAHSNGATSPSNKRTMRTLFLPIVLPSTVTSGASPLRNKLLTHRRVKEQQKMLNQLINPVVPIQQEWLMAMLTLVPESLMEGQDRQLLAETLLGEVVMDFEKSMKRCVVRSVLIKPDVKGLEDEEEAPLPVSPLGLDFSRPWHNSFIQAKEQILSNLHIVHPILKSLLDIGYTAFSDLLILSIILSRSEGPIDCESLKTSVNSSCSNSEEKIMNTWYPKVINLFTQKKALDGVKLDKADSFYNSVATLMSNQLKELLRRTVEAFVKLFDPEDRSCLPIFKMELTLDDEKIEFYPSFQDLEEAILFIVTRIGQTLQNIQTVHSWLTGGTTTLDTELPNHVIAWATSALKKYMRDNLEGPKECFEKYVERYGWLIDGTACAQIERFEAEEHSFDEYTAFIDEFFTLSKEIMSLPPLATFPMIHLDCDDLKQGLADKAKSFAKILMERIVANHREENEKICREFEAIKERALKVPETTEEMMETIAYIKKAKTKGIQELFLRIKRINYFLDVYLFAPEDLELNATVILWPKKINEVFDEHDDLIEQSRVQRESELTQKNERLVVEIGRLVRCMSELEEYSQLDCMQQYVTDLRGLQKRIQEADETVTFINKEEILFKWKLSDFPLLDSVKVEIEPYQKLFGLILKWQRTEKRWMDGDFLDLNGESMEAEIDDFFREIYKMSKVFQQKQKKIKQEREKIAQRRKVVEEKIEEEKKANPILTMCSSVLEQIKDFKVENFEGGRC
uniref:Dynein heavy chain linker domain-containing protein n=1 Tax=Nothoprocta perdicaria TaxID=30464 RepID=A0A8C6ZHR7_NOTPE